MPRALVEVITDDLTGQEHNASEVEDVVLKFGYKEWKLVLTEDSKRKVQELLDPVTKGLPFKDTTPSWAKVQPPADQTATTVQPQTVTVVPPDTKTVRRWWEGLSATELGALGLNKAPGSGRGKIPDPVMAAFVETHEAPAPGVTPTTFSG